MAGVTMDYTLTGGINRNFPAAIYSGTDAAVLYNISATNVCRDIHSVVTFHGLTPNNNVYVQLIGGNMWNVPVAVSLNGATPVNWASQTACKDPGVPGCPGRKQQLGAVGPHQHDRWVRQLDHRRLQHRRQWVSWPRSDHGGPTARRHHRPPGGTHRAGGHAGGTRFGPFELESGGRVGELQSVVENNPPMPTKSSPPRPRPIPSPA